MKVDKLNDKVEIVTRFPPSPTGLLHIGGVRTALFNYLFAKKQGGKIYLRFEDTDVLRSKMEFEGSITAGLSWLGFVFDNEKPIKQSERISIYRMYLKKLVATGTVYFSKEESGEGKRDEVIRFRNPNKKITFHDMIRGDITFDTTDLGDFVVAKSLEEPLYHLAVVVDDFEMAVTDIIRGDDHISNTPRQILIGEALGFPTPNYAHIPLILASDRSKLSKRDGNTSIEMYRDLGYLPEALINYLALLGWNPGTEQEIFSMKELIEQFDISKVQKSGAIFNIEKLKWFNRHYLCELSPEDKLTKFLGYCKTISISKSDADVILSEIQSITGRNNLIELIFDRVSTFGELKDLFISKEFDYLFNRPIYAKEILLWKGEGDWSALQVRLEKLSTIILNISEGTYDKATIKDALWPFVLSEGKGESLWPLRVCLSGKQKSPDPFILSEVLGKKETLARVREAINLVTVK